MPHTLTLSLTNRKSAAAGIYVSFFTFCPQRYQHRLFERPNHRFKLQHAPTLANFALNTQKITSKIPSPVIAGI
jgi:hypothetical protein